MSDDSERRREIEARTFKALPRDPNQKEHKKPRAFIHRPDEDPEAAEEARKNASLTDAAKTIKTEDFSLEKLGKQPCVRNALLPGIGGGLGVGAVRFVLGGSAMAFVNWSSGSFVGISIIAYNWCQRKRTLEKDGIRKAVKVLDAKQAMKEKTAQGSAPSTEAATVTPPPGEAASSAASSSYYNADKRDVSFWNSFKFW